MKKRNKMKHFRVDEEMNRLIELAAEKNHCSETEIANKAFEKFFANSMTDEEYFISKLENEEKKLKKLNIKFHILADTFRSFIPLFIFLNPKIKLGYERPDEFNHAKTMTNIFFKHMLEDMPQNDFEFFARLQEAMVIEGG